jgi:hypothetical protein
MRNFGLQEGKKIMFRYRGTGKFAVARRIRQEQAIERNNAYQKQISTPEGIQEYVNLKIDVLDRKSGIGKKQLAKLKALMLTLQKRKK